MLWLIWIVIMLLLPVMAGIVVWYKLQHQVDELFTTSRMQHDDSSAEHVG